MSAKSLSRDEIKGKLLQGSFMNNGPHVPQLSDPVADTPMLIALDKLRPYEFNPRINRNPLFDQLKTSILNRGLDAPPPITRRPGEEFFIIRNGGNTRLAILNELWRETRDEQFLRIQCLFRPWPERGDIVALTGHLAENDMHGELTFVERALSIERAKALYEQEAAEPISQRELARRLAADGYPVSQPHISKMQDCVHFLLPAIPNLLYSGMGKPQIERLTNLRRTAAKSWAKYSDSAANRIDFESLFSEVLASFDDGGEFKFDRFQDELIHQMEQPLGKDYNWLKLDILDANNLQQRVIEPETPPRQSFVDFPAGGVQPVPETPKIEREKNPNSVGAPPQPSSTASGGKHQKPVSDPEMSPDAAEEEFQERIQAHVIKPITGLTPRVQAMKKQLADATGEPIPDFDASCLHSIPVQVGGLHPISDLWYIERQIDEPTELRNQIFGLVCEVIEETRCPAEISPSDLGAGFYLHRTEGQTQAVDMSSTTTMTLLDALSGRSEAIGGTSPYFTANIGRLLLGLSKSESIDAFVTDRLSDQALVKIFRVIRLARRLIELEAAL
ncbi:MULTISPECIES: ParB family protein [unclassified Pseudomonas]|uniref:ParB family protein n=1 Tax=unclassified Pseudomonas TaxID=196821 RepID=UPI002B221A66|nr:MULTISPECIES: ParB family protein [unclassified Pseudomonas]MEA9976516.1 ParB family protein [Pseudomonas sp. RTS4]MEB0198354.1 ParB family protein [Pseudomonas sp. 5S4]MEB0244069.1 ParB family protein [Pseudomonas sp. 10S5]